MSLFTRLLSFAKRNSDPLNDERYFSDMVQAASATGLKITPDTARRSAAVLACVRVLSETIAHLPFVLYRRDGDARIRESTHPLYNLLKNAPNRWQTSFEFREMMMGHVLLRGNAYAQKVYNASGGIAELVPLNPTKVTPRLMESGDVVYEYRGANGQPLRIAAADMFHLKGYASDGLVGISPIAEAREAVGLSIAAEEFGARTFQNDAQPGGILEHPGKLGEEAISNLRRSMQENHGGVHNARKYMILEEGMKWTRIGMSSQDTQYIETRKFQLEEIARIFRVPPHLIGHLERATFSNIEHQGLEFVTHTILPWLRRWEQAISFRLMTEPERQVLYSEFLVDGLLRGDINARYQAYAVGRQWGWLSADDVRRMENLDPLPESQGTKYLLPLNMIDASKLDQYLLTNNATPAAADGTVRRFIGKESFEPVLRSVVERLADRVAKSPKPFESHRAIIAEGIAPVVVGLLRLNETTDAETTADALVKTFIDDWKGEARAVGELVEDLLQRAQREVIAE